MSDIGKTALKTKIDNKVYENSSQAITGTIMNEILQDVVDTLADGGNLDAGSVNTANIADGAVTDAKLQNPVSVSQNTETGGYDLAIGESSVNLAGQDEIKTDVKNSVGYDYQVADENGIAIMGCRSGHLKTKNFDSENVTDKLDTIEDGAEVNDVNTTNSGGDEFEIVGDNEDYAVLAIKDGHLKTKYFDSKMIIKTEGGSPLSDFDITDDDNYAILRVQDGYPKTKRFNGETIKRNSDIVGASDLYETIVVNIADYDNNLLNVYNAIASTKQKHYTILIPEGTYDVSSWFSQTQIENSNETHFRGVELKDYVKLLGLGASDKVILQWMNPDDATHWGYISTLNTGIWNELENLTVKANNIRYAVHDDHWDNTDRYLRIKNCNFIVSGQTSRAWGAGCNGGYDAIFENCKFIMEYYAPYATASPSSYIEPFVLHDNYYNIRGDSHLVFKNCRFYNPYTAFRYYYSDSWEQVAYNSGYDSYNADKEDYAVNDYVNMPNDTSYSYKCLYANTQVPPYVNGRPSINFGFGAEGATRVLYVEVIGCKLNTYIWVSPELTRVTGYANEMGSAPELNRESSDSKKVIIDII